VNAALAIGRDEAEELLLREADLLDDGDLEGWLGLYTYDARYRIPGYDERGEPATAIADDDRARLEDRVWRLRSGNAHAQIPPSRTCRFVTGVRIEPDGEEARVRSRLLIVEARRGERRAVAALVAHRLRRVGTQLRIVEKTIHLVDAAFPLYNLTFVL
jgi:benzoate/toluate 1,2-dioxygenase beta subunit